LRLATNTLVIVTSDNGPVVEDGYADGAAENLDGHQPAGPFRGGKYTIFEGGTRVPFLLRWPTHVQPGVSDALICLMDLPASMAALVGQKVPAGGLPDSQNVLPALCGQTTTGRDKLVEHDGSLALALRDHDWKFIGRPSPTAAKSVHLPPPHLFKLDHDLGEARNLAPDQPDKVRQLSESLDCAISNSVTHP
jgi:arylsulfatase A-like enzyme